ncbi:MAG: hypothetical protein ACYSWW_08525 [Planctomycetota bacterium]
MKSPIAKLAATAAIITVVALGLFEFIGTDGASGVVWAEVARKVQSSQGLVYRCVVRGSDTSDEPDFLISYNRPRHSRLDSYKGGEITKSYYDDYDTRTCTAVYHPRKCYVLSTYGMEQAATRHLDRMNPKHHVETILSCEHRKLGLRTIDGVSCEGLETADPAFFGSPSEVAGVLDAQVQLWVNAETDYPVLIDCKLTTELDGKAKATEWTMDQFQWDVELDPGIFEPNIPADYEDISPL